MNKHPLPLPRTKIAMRINDERSSAVFSNSPFGRFQTGKVRRLSESIPSSSLQRPNYHEIFSKGKKFIRSSSEKPKDFSNNRQLDFNNKTNNSNDTNDADNEKINLGLTFNNNTNLIHMISMKEYRIKLHFMSNWGHPELITCSEVDFLDRDRKIINGCKVFHNGIELENPKNIHLCNIKDLDKLVNRTLIKTTVEESWVSKWIFTEPLILVFKFMSPKPPDYIRIFNGKYLPEANVKHFRVYSDNDRFICEGDVPKSFGTEMVFKLGSMAEFPPIEKLNVLQQQFNEEIFNDKKGSFNDMKNIGFGVDKFGKIYVPYINEISITLVEPFDISSDQIGLNALELFCEDGQVISNKYLSDTSTICILNGYSYNSPYNLFKGNKKSQNSDDMWNAKWEKDNPPTVRIVFERPKKIVMVRVWNHNGIDDSYKNGTKKIKLSSGKETLWRGVLTKSRGMTSKTRNGINDIWIVEKLPWENHVFVSQKDSVK